MRHSMFVCLSDGIHDVHGQSEIRGSSQMTQCLWKTKLLTTNGHTRLLGFWVHKGQKKT